MFRGIDPDGLDDLAAVVVLTTVSMRRQTRTALDVLHQNGRGAEITEIRTTIGRIEAWGADAADTLRWRADIVRTGQDTGLNVGALTRAVFASQAIFSIDTVDETYRAWIAGWRGSNQRVTEAYTRISAWLDQSLRDWDVTNNDLHNIEDTLAALSGRELDRVIADLSPTQLERWIDEMGNGINGFSRDEKQLVFAMLASNSSGASLGKVHDAILAAANREELTDFGLAIQAASADQVIVDFISYAVARGLAANRYSGTAPSLAAGGIEAPAAINAATRTIVLADGALGLIITGSLTIAAVAGGNTGDPLRSLLTAIGRGDESRLKAAVFVSLVTTVTKPGALLQSLLRSVDLSSTGLDGDKHDRAASELLRAAQLELLDQATQLMVSDANGIVAQLATALDTDGALTTAYLYELVDREQTGRLSQFVDAVRGGNEVDPAVFAESGVDPDYRYPQAQNLGFVAGSLHRAVTRSAQDAKSDINSIVAGSQLAATVAGLGFAKILEAVASSSVVTDLIAEFAGTSYWAAKTQIEIDESLDRLIETITTTLQPQRPLSSNPPNLGEALMSWDDRYDTVLGQ